MSAVLLGGIVSLAFSREFYDSCITSAFFSIAIASAFIILAVLRRSWSDALAVVVSGVLLAWLDLRILHYPYRSMGWFSFFGMASFAVLGLRTIWGQQRERNLMILGFAPTLLFVASEYVASDLLDLTAKLHPKVFDLYLYYFDCSLRVQIAFLTGKLFVIAPWLRSVCFLFYLALPFGLALVYAARLRFSIRSAIPVTLAFLLTGPVGVLFYNMLPACGPIHVFGPRFPLFPVPLSGVVQWHLQAIVLPGPPRNAIPSLHMTWVLLVWWSSRKLSPWIRTVAFAFLAFTALATMGLGEHYFIDLVVAYPFAVMILSLCSYTIPFSHSARRIAFLWGIFVTLLWFALLSFATQIFWISPVLPWAMVACTVAVSVVLQSRMQTAIEAATVTPAEQPSEKISAMGHHA